MNTIRHISFEQFAANFAEIMDTVREARTPVVVDYASGEQLLIKPVSPAQPAHEPRAGAAPATDERTSQQPPPDQPPDQPSQDEELDTDNISSVGAMYDIDPNSVTPG